MFSKRLNAIWWLPVSSSTITASCAQRLRRPLPKPGSRCSSAASSVVVSLASVVSGCQLRHKLTRHTPCLCQTLDYCSKILTLAHSAGNLQQINHAAACCYSNLWNRFSIFVLYSGIAIGGQDGQTPGGPRVQGHPSPKISSDLRHPQNPLQDSTEFYVQRAIKIVHKHENFRWKSLKGNGRRRIRQGKDPTLIFCQGASKFLVTPLVL